MGKPIVYCGECGKSLHEEEFERGKAHVFENRPFCIECRPLPKKATPALSSSSTRISRKVSSGHIPIVSRAGAKKISSGPIPHVSGGGTTRRMQSEARRDSSRTPILLGTILGGAALIVIVVAVASSGHGPNRAPDSPEPAPERPAPKHAAPPPIPLRTADPAAAAILALESFSSSSSDPEAVLQKCDEARATLRGTPHEAKLRAIEDRARSDRQARNRERQLTGSLEEVRKIRASDARFEKRADVQALLQAVLQIAGPRKGDIEKAIAEYERDYAAFARRAADAPPADAASSSPPLGPFELDASGCVNHWLVLGPFGNRKDPEGAYDHDLLKTQELHVPSPGLEVQTREGTRLKWTPWVVADGKVLFPSIPFFGLASRTEAPAIAFAACWLVAESDMEIKLRMHAEMGFQLYFDHQRICNQPKGCGFKEDEFVFRRKLSRGPHLALFKIATTGGGSFGLRLRVTTLSGEKAPGLRVWTKPPDARKVLFSEKFDQGRGRFAGGDVVEGGADGSKALSVPKSAVWIENIFSALITPAVTVRFKVKPLSATQNVEVIFWSNKIQDNCWYHVRGLKADEWNVVEFKVADARGGWLMKGPGLEGDIPFNIRIYLDDPAGNTRVLIDDFEILE